MSVDQEDFKVVKEYFTFYGFLLNVLYMCVIVCVLCSPRHPACVSRMHSSPHKVKGNGDAHQILGFRRIILPILALEPSPGTQKHAVKQTNGGMESP